MVAIPQIFIPFRANLKLFNVPVLQAKFNLIQIEVESVSNMTLTAAILM